MAAPKRYLDLIFSCILTHPLSLIMTDADHFKLVCPLFKEIAGDEGIATSSTKKTGGDCLAHAKEVTLEGVFAKTVI